jgi:hypothetical protein
LLDGNQILTQNYATLFDSTGSNNASQSLTSTAGQDNDARASSAIRKHLAQALLLIGTDLSLCLNFYFKLRRHRIMLEVIFFYQREVSLNAFFLHLLDS